MIKPCGMSQGEMVQVLYNMQTAINALRADWATLVAKLNVDAGVTDTDYAATTSSAISGVSNTEA